MAINSSKKENHDRRGGTCGEAFDGARDQQAKIAWQAVFLGLVSLFWLIWKTGRKPTRIQYPCQQAALNNIGLFLLPPVAFFAHRWLPWLRHRIPPGHVLITGVVVIVIIVSGGGTYALWRWYSNHQSEAYYHSLATQGPFGKRMTAPAIAGGTAFYTIPHAMALPSAHRVVSVHDPNATSWTFSCMSTGPCPEYYGDDSFVDQAVVDRMVARGMMALTGEGDLPSAWRAVIPGYTAGEVIAIKLNFNDSIAGGGVVGYGDNDAYVDALPQIVNSIIAGLKEMGVQEENIWVFDVSRYITDRFRTLIDYPSVHFIDRTGNGIDVAPATFDSLNPSALIEFGTTTYNGTHRIADLLLEADYLINIPIMKRHGGAGISLGLKNHMGSINGFYTGGHAMHDYIYLNNGEYDSNSNPLVDINLNANLFDKTVLVVGDALYGCWSSNNTPPERWASFNDDSPNMLFFGADPVALDSVMFDYLDREGDVNPKSEDVLILAANAGLGVHERWNNDIDREYNTIDYIEIGGGGDSSREGGGGGGGCFIRSIF